MSVSDNVTATLRAEEHGHQPVVCICLDHVLMSGGTTFQGRGWYDNVCACMKAGGGHGVMYESDRK